MNMNLLIYLILLGSFACAKKCSNATLCISNENDVECQATAIHKISDVPDYAKACTAIDIQVTSGTHILNTTLEFSSAVRNIKIHGSSNGKPSIIVCLNRTGIKFSEKKSSKSVHLINLIFINCSREGKATLRFYYTTYILEKVLIESSEESALYAYNCNVHLITNCTFTNSSKGHIQIRFHKVDKNLKSIRIRDSYFIGGQFGIEIKSTKSYCQYKLSVTDCNFLRPKQFHVVIESANTPKYLIIVNIKHSKFFASSGVSYGISFKYTLETSNNMNVSIHNCSFISNSNGALQIIRTRSTLITDCTFFSNNGTAVSIESVNSRNYKLSSDILIWRNLFISNSNGAIHSIAGNFLVIKNCTIAYNQGTAVFINARKVKQSIIIAYTRFINNSRALHVKAQNKNTFTNVSSCIFQKNNLSQAHGSGTSALTIEYYGGSAILSASQFEDNYGTDGNCSCLDIKNDNATLSNVLIQNNNCTGITLRASKITILSWVNVTRNFGQLGGALQILHSHITLNKGKLNLVGNIAELYGGGIYIDESCESLNENKSCFFDTSTDIDDIAIILEENIGKLGGDAIFGGCLSECYVKDKLINITDPSNIFYHIVSLQELLPSTFAEVSKQVAFCFKSSSFFGTCSNTQKIKVYRGEIFPLSLIIASSTCLPTVGFMQACLRETGQRAQLVDLGQESYKKSKKYCDSYMYSVSADLNLTFVTMELQIIRNLPLSYSPALLTVELDDCPIGYQFNSTERKCACSDLLKSKQIKCTASTYSLEVPPFTWIGKIDGNEAVNKHCQYCHSEGDVTIHKLEDTNKLCAHNREGILCGRCSGNYSLLLGGHKCGYCSKSVHRGVLLTLGFALIGVATVLLLLRLNLTVSTGLINGLIFYSNIVYANHNIFLPINRESDSQSSLDSVVSVLSTFLAWMNLDFGIVTCFFDGYNTYISSWMQFIFPLYIWLLICTIMLASRYSSRISRIATSNTVSVLATLLLLSYTKLLTTVIEVSSFTDAIFLNDSSRHRVWVLDGTILYLQGRHVPLFIVSMITIVVYILPFTLLILLGPILQAKSRRYKLLKWVKKLKPLFDAFNKPNEQGYRYWTGILLLARLGMLLIFEYSALDGCPIELVTVSSTIAVLLVIWIALNKHDITSFNSKTRAKYFDLFFLMNLGIFAVSSTYITKFVENVYNTSRNWQL